jgi:NHL repeat
MLRLRPVIAAIAIAAGALAFNAAPAAALSKNVFSTSFAGSGASALSNPFDVEVDLQSHDVYVTDPANHRVEKFTAAGDFILAFGREVDKTTGANVCTAESGDECQPGAPGAEPGAFTAPQYLAVDNSCSLHDPPLTAATTPTCEEFDPSAGDVYVGDHVIGEGSGDVQKFDSSGNLLTVWAQGGLLDGSTDSDGNSFAGAAFGEGLTGVAVDPVGNLFVFSSLRYFEFAQDGGFLHSLRPEVPGYPVASSLGVDAEDNLYLISEGVTKVSPQGAFLGVVAPGSVALAVDLASRDLYTFGGGGVEHFTAYCASAPNCTTPIDTFGSGALSNPSGIAIDSSSGTAYVADTGDQRVAVFTAVPYLPDATASAKPLNPTSEALGGVVDPAAAGPVTACQFEYGAAAGGYGLGSVQCNPSASAGSPIVAKTAVTSASDLTGLEAGSTYHYRLLLENENGAASSYDQTFTTLPLAPVIGAESISEVDADTAQVHAQITPGGGGATYHTTYSVEYITSEQFERNEAKGLDGFTGSSHSPILDAGSSKTPQSVTATLSDLASNTTYFYRVIAENATAPKTGETRSFSTLPFVPIVNDPCPNAHVRQQTGAAPLLDCRAYELVSAADTGGYDVESNLIKGQTPFGGYPQAAGRVLYGVHGGGIPGSGLPTNRGLDPYLATRGESGWSTAYVGIPANDPYAEAPFSSPLLAADAPLETFAFGGAGLCSPCFANGSSGIPLRLPNGSLVQGLAGQLAEPEATPDGYIAKPLSANGAHLVFGSAFQVQPDGNENGDVSIYDRNLTTGKTHVVSKTSTGEDPPGENLPCLQGAGSCHSPGDANGIAELDISANGSRIVVAQKVSTDTAGNVYWHPYMNVGDSIRTVDLAPGTTHGVLYDGMSADGSKVFFTTTDKLLVEDTDNSADIYMWSQKGEEEEAPLTLISTGPEGPSNTDSCSPVPNKGGEHWNAVGSEANCGAVAIGGGGGVASGDGSIYFLSPEKLTPPCACAEPGDPTANQPNLYLARPGSAPRFVATLAPNDQLVLDSVKEAEAGKTADFQLTPDGRFAAFPSILAPLPEEETGGHTEIYRYAAAPEALACISCTPTGAASTGDSSLASDGLSLSDDGRVFFDSADRLAATDTDGKKDVYEWAQSGAGNCQRSSPAFSKRSGACLALISAGTSPFDSGLLSASANGTDAFFFTRDTLAPQDENGPTMKVYDARENGGFPFTLSAVPCQASDECHGAGSPAPGPLAVGSLTGTEGNVEERKCKKGFVEKHGHCVKVRHHKHRRRHHRRVGGRPAGSK